MEIWCLFINKQYLGKHPGVSAFSDMLKELRLCR